MALPLDLTLRRSELDPKKRPLHIDAERVVYDGEEIACAQVCEVRYGSLRLVTDAVPVWVSDIHELQLRDHDGHKLRITFSASFGARREAAAELFAAIEDGLWEAVTRRLAERMAATLRAREPLRVGELRFDAAGAHLRVGLLFKKEVVVGWDRLVATVRDGKLHLGDGAKVTQSMTLTGTWNAVVLAHALGQLRGPSPAPDPAP